MTDAELRDHLTTLNETAEGAQETLRGVLDALAVISQTIERTVQEEADGHDDGKTVAEEGEALLRNAAHLLEDTAEDIHAALDSDTGTSPLKEAIVEVSVPDSAGDPERSREAVQ